MDVIGARISERGADRDSTVHRRVRTAGLPHDEAGRGELRRVRVGGRGRRYGRAGEGGRGKRGLGRNIDGFFRAITDPVAKAKTAIERRLTDYLREKEARARREREEQERLAREAAETARREAEVRARALADEQSLQAAIAAEKAAETASADLVKAAQAAAVKPAELSRTRGDYGAVSSLRTQWVFEGIDRAEIDLEALRFHIPADGLEKAVRSFIKAGGRELRGTRIHETTVASVR